MVVVRWPYRDQRFGVRHGRTYRENADLDGGYASSVAFALGYIGDVNCRRRC